MLERAKKINVELMKLVSNYNLTIIRSIISGKRLKKGIRSTYHWLVIIRAAVGRCITVQGIGDGIWYVYYRNVLLGYFDVKQFVDKEQYLSLTRLKV